MKRTLNLRWWMYAKAVARKPIMDTVETGREKIECVMTPSRQVYNNC
jgi:hypothetical protein